MRRSLSPLDRCHSGFRLQPGGLTRRGRGEFLRELTLHLGTLPGLHLLRAIHLGKVKNGATGWAFFDQRS